MNWITSIETAVEYIENNLLNKLDYDDIAACAYCSSHHFQRMFSVFAGCTLGEYIRSRRMTLAGAELKGSEIKILDLAIKYGYENPESFTRAFAKFHGITPSDAKKESAKIIAYTRFVNYEYAVGGNIMTYSIVTKNENAAVFVEKLFDYGEYVFYAAQEIPDGIFAVFDLIYEDDCKKMYNKIVGEWLPSTGFKLREKSAYIINDKMLVPINLMGGVK